jgi:DNA (cytosine-5)-methyltransferase 1
VLEKQKFIDLFSGCGGLSLGLLRSGLQGVLGIEKCSGAFSTFSENLIVKNKFADVDPFLWPNSIQKTAMTVRDLIENYPDWIEENKGEITYVVGGPPCQGFSMAGKRVHDDPRNELYLDQLELAQKLDVDMVLVENVPGMGIPFFKSIDDVGQRKDSYLSQLKERMAEFGFKEVEQSLLYAADFGVPQLRTRYITLGISDRLLNDSGIGFFDHVKKLREGFLTNKSLPLSEPVSTSEAISDLEIRNDSLTICEDPFSQSRYLELSKLGQQVSSYQKLMHGNLNGQVPNSTRFTKHRPDTIKNFKLIQKTCTPGKHLSLADKRRIGTKKMMRTVLHPDQPSATLTTMPDDILHYSDPRILTVREYARIQSFPDWFNFLGNFTTGGLRRKSDCPRYTQIGNAVPPLLAEIIGLAMQTHHYMLKTAKQV